MGRFQHVNIFYQLICQSYGLTYRRVLLQNSYLWHRVIDSFSAGIKTKIYKIKISFVSPGGRRLGLTSLVLIYYLYFNIS